MAKVKYTVVLEFEEKSMPSPEMQFATAMQHVSSRVYLHPRLRAGAVLTGGEPVGTWTLERVGGS